MKLQNHCRLKNKEVFDSSLEREPLELEVGSGMIIPGLEKEMLGMKKGDKKTITVESQHAYGEPREELKRELPKGPVPEGMELKVGAMIYLKGPDGQPFPAKILEVKDEKIRFSKRALERDPFDWFKENRKKVGDIITTRIHEVLK